MCNVPGNHCMSSGEVIWYLVTGCHSILSCNCKPEGNAMFDENHVWEAT